MNPGRRAAIAASTLIAATLSGCPVPDPGETAGPASTGTTSASSSTGTTPTGGPTTTDVSTTTDATTTPSDTSSSTGGPTTSGTTGVEEGCEVVTFEPVPASPIAWSGFPACDPQSNFCLMHPAPMHALTHAGMSPTGTAFSVASNIVASWRGQTGDVYRLATNQLLSDVFALADDDVWVAGSGSTVAHFDGKTWTVDEIPDGSWLSAIWASGPNDVWTVGNFGVIAHYDGMWSSISIPGDASFEDVAGTGPDDVWAVGGYGFDAGLVRHWDGMAWTDVPVMTTQRLEAVWATSPDDVWVVGGGFILHGDAQGLEPYEIAVATENDGYNDVWGTSPSDVWIMGNADTLHFDGSEWTRSDPRGTHVFGRSETDVVALGAAAMRFDGNAWTEEFVVDEPDMNAAWAVTEDDLWFGGDDGRLLRAKDGQLLRATVGADDFSAIWSSGPDDIWLARANEPTLLRGDGSKFCEIVVPDTYGVQSLSGTGPNEVWVVTGQGALQRWGGVEFTQEPLFDLEWVFAVSPTSVWASGDAVYRRDGTEWSYVAGGQFGDHFGPVWGAAPDDVWVSEGLEMMRWDGMTLAKTGDYISAGDPLAGSGTDDIWSMGIQTHHFDGQAWNLVPSANLSLNAIAATSKEVWATGFRGLVVRKTK